VAFSFGIGVVIVCFFIVMSFFVVMFCGWVSGRVFSCYIWVNGGGVME
jgi:hypothetical protein